MHVVVFRCLEELAPYGDDWDRLAAGAPTRSWAWCSSWWRHYGGSGRLCTLGVFQGHRLVGLAPWFVQPQPSLGRVLRFLGSGEVCSDYLGLMLAPGVRPAAVEALSQWLTQAGGDERDGWDMIDLEGVADNDRSTLSLAEQLADRGCHVHRRALAGCWRIALPDSWKQYLDGLSKSHRKQVRRAERDLLATGRARLHTVATSDELPEGMDQLVRLHQSRRRALGQPGAFASPRFHAFHREVAGRMLQAGQLHLHRLCLDGRPVAAEYHLSGGDVLYAYQGGLDPAALHHEPGNLITIATLRRGLELGYRAFDFLRGDEPYKAHWGAEPRGMLRLQITNSRAAARLRLRLWRVAQRVKDCVRRKRSTGVA